MSTIELLAPAKNLEVGKAAIDAGADAVYIGAPLFSARQAAGNSVDDIRALCAYAHTFGCKVLVALNTLLTEEEKQEAVRIAWDVYKAGADALILQDLSLLTMPDQLPPIRLHASTQCDNVSPERVLQLQALGFKRVVLARELSLEEIRAVRAVTDVELEAFVHGALCVSYSGRCYLSEALCGRSANRGCCAQMCRQRYDLLDADRHEIMHQKYLLSLHDMDRSQHLQELMEAGVSTFKIEGRLKDADYVQNVVAYYRQLLDSLIGARPDAVISHAFTPNPEKTFHRGGIDYFLHGRTARMACFDSPKSTGEVIGKVLGTTDRFMLVEGAERLHNGDGLCYGDKGLMVNRVEGNRVYPREMPAIRVGTELSRNYDIDFQRQLAQSKPRKRLVDISLKETSEGFALTLRSLQGENLAHIEVKSEKIPADNAERALAVVRESLAKLGDSPYQARQTKVEWAQPYFLRVSTINEWRRMLVAEAAEVLTHCRPETPVNTDASHIQLAREAASEQGYKPDMPLMTCRYCLLHEMGRCRKQTHQPLENEPRYLRTASGVMLRLQFDCKNCQMLIFRAEG